MKRPTILVIFIWILSFAPQIAAAPLELVTLQYPPYEYKENGEVKGIAVKIVKEGFQRIGRPIKIKLLPWARAIHMIEQGQADAIFTAYKTPERQLFADYSKEILMPQTVSLFVLRDSTIEWNGDISSISQYRIGAVIKVSYGDIFDGAVNNNILTRVDRVSSGELNMKKLLMKRFDILISNKYGALDILTKMGKLNHVRELSPIVQSVPSYIAFSKKRNLISMRDKFDSVLKEMKNDGTYERIINEYFQ